MNIEHKQRVGVINPVDDRPDWGKIVFIEYDFEFDFYWLYIASDNDKMNDKLDPRFRQPYWCMIPSISENLLIE